MQIICYNENTMHTYDDSTEFRQRRSKITTKISERPFVRDALTTPEARMEYFQGLGADGFVDVLTSANRTLIKEHKKSVLVNENYNFIIDDEDPANTFHVLPAPEDKVPLLKELYEVARSVSESQLTSPDHIAALIGFGINAIHPFNEANGRTARTIYALLGADETRRSAMIEQASQGAENGGAYLDPATFRQPLLNMMQRMLKTHQDVDGELVPLVYPAISSRTPFQEVQPTSRAATFDTSQLMECIFRDQFMAPMVAAMVASHTDVSCTDKVLRDYNGTAQTFDISTFFEIASEQDMEILRNCYRAISNEYALTLIDVMAGRILKEDRMVVATHQYGACAATAPLLITALARGDISLDAEGYSTLAEKVAANDIIQLN